MDFFSKAWGLGTLRPPVGPGQRPGGGSWGEAHGGSLILVILGVNFNHIVSPLLKEEMHLYLHYLNEA